MIRVVFDTNILVSALSFGGPPGALLLAASAGALPLFSSTVLQAELLEVLEMRFDWDPERLTGKQQRLARLWTLIEPSEIVTDCTDPDDNRVLECALASQATHIVTGDRELLALDPFRAVRIVKAARFLAERPWERDAP